MSTKQDGRRYPRIIKWSEADHQWIGSAPPLAHKCCRGDTVPEVSAQLEVIVADLAEHYPTSEQISGLPPHLMLPIKKLHEDSLTMVLPHISKICVELKRRIEAKTEISQTFIEEIRKELGRSMETVEAFLSWPFEILANYRRDSNEDSGKQYDSMLSTLRDDSCQVAKKQNEAAEKAPHGE